jgi:hypothetical protein
MPKFLIEDKDGKKYQVEAESAEKAYADFQAFQGSAAQPEQVQPEEIGVGEMFSQAGRNFTGSAKQFGKDVVEAVASPVQSIMAIIDLGAGALQNALPESLVQAIGEDPRSREIARKVGEYYVQKYGSVDAAMRAFAKDPVGTSADVSAILGIGAATTPAKVSGALRTASAVTDPMQVAAKLAGGAANVSGKVAREIAGMGTGAGSTPVKIAFESGRQGGAAQNQFRQNITGAADMETALDAAKNNLDQMIARKSQEYQSSMSAVKADSQILGFNDVDNALNKANKKVRFKAEVVDPEAANVIAKMESEISRWKQLDPAQYHTPAGMDALKQKLWNFVPENDFGTKKRGAAMDIYHGVANTIKKQSPIYAKTMGKYSEAQQEIAQIRKALSMPEGKGRFSADTAMRKLQSLMRDNVNTNYGQRTKLAQKLEESGTQSFMPALAGQSLNQLMPRGLQGQAALPLTLATSSLGGLPYVAGQAALTSPRIVGEVANRAGQAMGGIDAINAMRNKMVPQEGRALLDMLMYQGQQQNQMNQGR